MKQLYVKLDTRGYFIFFMNKLLCDSLSYWPLTGGDRVLLVTSDYIASIYLDLFCVVLKKLGVVFDWLILPDGEQSKSLAVLDVVVNKLLVCNYDRNTVLVALGGGVIGDLIGFVAAVYQRGIRFIQVPTTLLAQVDAAIGGKTGVNHMLGKNMIGAFHQPVAVVICLNFLSTLSVREFSSGLAEVIKYAIVFDADFFSWLEVHLEELLSLNYTSLMYCVYRCCEIKVSVVVMDECDQGVRGLLNFGHTYGHAIEAYLGYTRWSHGEAVSAGMMMAVNTAVRLQILDVTVANRIRLLLLRARLPVYGPQGMSPEDYLSYMLRDKKSVSGKLKLILPVSIGCAKCFLDVNSDVILSSIKDSYCFV